MLRCCTQCWNKLNCIGLYGMQTLSWPPEKHNTLPFWDSYKIKYLIHNLRSATNTPTSPIPALIFLPLGSPGCKWRCYNSSPELYDRPYSLRMSVSASRTSIIPWAGMTTCCRSRDGGGIVIATCQSSNNHNSHACNCFHATVSEYIHGLHYDDSAVYLHSFSWRLQKMHVLCNQVHNDH